MLVSHTHKQPCCFTFFRLLVSTLSNETFRTTIQFLLVSHSHKLHFQPCCSTFFSLLVLTLSVETFQTSNLVPNVSLTHKRPTEFTFVRLLVSTIFQLKHFSQLISFCSFLIPTNNHVASLSSAYLFQHFQSAY